jgi:selenocysteine-specific elongation factor
MSKVRHSILGTAGHVDHGKSALIRALTGVETDRLKEERERGISIELGFAELALGDDIVLGVVDVPGHERFVKQMVAGAGGVDLAMLVVAADEGVMPQTVEHVDILSQLDVQGGVIVVTKVDLVDHELAEVAVEEVRDLCKGTFLEGRPAVIVSAVTGEGLGELKDVLRNEIAALPVRDDSVPFRLPVDRVFSMPGAGVIVTGTCWDGVVRTGDQLVLEPSGTKLRVRDVQAHGKPVEAGSAGQRLALALHGVKKDEVERGDQVVGAGASRSCTRFDARISLVPHYTGVLKNRQRAHVHHAGREVLARVSLLDHEEMSHDTQRATGMIQVHLESPLVAQPGDRFVLRFYSPLVTMAGGRVLSLDPTRRRRFDDDSLAELAILEEGDADELFLQELAEAATLGLLVADHPAFAAHDQVVAAGKRLYHAALSSDIGTTVTALLTEYVGKFPLRAGMPKEEMRRRVKFKGGSAEWTAFCDALTGAHGWHPAGDRVVLDELPPLDDSLVQAVTHLAAGLTDCGLAWPGIEAFLGSIPGGDRGFKPDEWLRHLSDRGDAVSVTPEFIVSAAALAKFRTDLATWFADNSTLSFSEFRDLSGLTRKLGIPMLEFLDRQSWTRREGDVRLAGSRLNEDS